MPIPAIPTSGTSPGTLGAPPPVITIPLREGRAAEIEVFAFTLEEAVSYGVQEQVFAAAPHEFPDALQAPAADAAIAHDAALPEAPDEPVIEPVIDEGAIVTAHVQAQITAEIAQGSPQGASFQDDRYPERLEPVPANPARPVTAHAANPAPEEDGRPEVRPSPGEQAPSASVQEPHPAREEQRPAPQAQRPAVHGSVPLPHAEGRRSGEKTERPRPMSESVRPVASELVAPHRDSLIPAIARAEQIEAALRAETAAPQPLQEVVPAPKTPNIQAPSATLAHAAPQTGATLTSAVGEAAQETPSTVRLEDEGRFASRIVRGLTAMVSSRGGSLTMRLDPPELGQLRVQMTLDRGVVTASFHAANPQAHALLEKSMAALRTALEAQGLTVERLHVQSTPQGGNQHAMSDERTDHQSRHDASGRESRGRRESDGRETGNRSPAFAGRLAHEQEGTPS